MRYCRRNDGEPGVRLFSAAEQLPADWNKLLPADHFLQSGHLAIYERAALPDVRYVYALVYGDKGPLAAVYFQLLRLREDHLDPSQLKPLQRIGWKAFLKLVRPGLLIAGHLFRHDVESFYYDHKASPFEAFRFYQMAIDAAVDQTGANAVLVKDIAGELVTYFQHYAPEYLLLRNDISMEMDLQPEWKTLKDYEKDLKHKYAQRLRKVRNAWEGVEIKELDTAEAARQETELFRLYSNISERQAVRLGHLSPSYLTLLKQRHPDQLKIWMITEQDNPIAFFSAWLHEDAFDMFYIGMDYSRNDSLQLYFNILFFGIEQAILHGKQRLIYGRTALEAKARLGCKPRYLSTYLYIRNSLVRNVIMRLQQNISEQEGEWENRHPFKPAKTEA